MYPVYVWPIYYLMKLIFNPDPILSSSFDQNRQNNQFIITSFEDKRVGFDQLGRGREGDVRLWYSVSLMYYHNEVGQQLVLEVHGKL
jgi:hypothetical protein